MAARSLLGTERAPVRRTRSIAFHKAWCVPRYVDVDLVIENCREVRTVNPAVALQPEPLYECIESGLDPVLLQLVANLLGRSAADRLTDDTHLFPREWAEVFILGELFT